MPTLTPISEAASGPLCSETTICSTTLACGDGAALGSPDEGAETLLALSEFLDETALYPGTDTFPGTSTSPQTPLLRPLVEV